jgi:hypothetical protein
MLTPRPIGTVPPTSTVVKFATGRDRHAGFQQGATCGSGISVNQRLSACDGANDGQDDIGMGIGEGSRRCERVDLAIRQRWHFASGLIDNEDGPRFTRASSRNGVWV